MRAAVLALLAAAATAATAARDLEGEFRTHVEQRGYPLEKHETPTADGRLLRLFRLPKPGAPPVFFQHGILDSSWAWVFNSEFQAIGLQLYDAGYDVWLGNSRGNSFSMRWADGTDAVNSTEFWNLTFDDMAREDVPAVISAVLGATGQSQLAWVGHSQGTSQLFIAASDAGLRDWVAERVAVFVALSPIAFLGHTEARVLKVLADSGIQKLGWPLFQHGFLTADGWKEGCHLVCEITLGAVCKVTIDALFGSTDLDSGKTLINYTKSFPFGTSFKDIVHYSQGVVRNTFARFDYGSKKNAEVYGQSTPPVYDLTQLSVPTALFIGGKDVLTAPEDLQQLGQLLPSDKVVFNKTYEGFSHITWTLGNKEAGSYVSDVMQVLQQHYTPGLRDAQGLVI